MKHVSIVVKFATIMALFGLFAIAIAGYSASRIYYMNGAYSDLLAHQNKAALMIARANRSMQMARSAIADILVSRTEEGNLAAKSDLDKALDSFVQRMDGASAVVPTDEKIPLLKAEGLSIVNTACAPSVKRGMAATTEDEIKQAQMSFLTECQPLFAPYTKKSTTITDELIAESDAKSSELDDSANRIAMTTVGSVIIGLAAVLIIGFFAVRAWIIRPIKNLQDSMLALAGGDLSVTVPGTERSDEIGKMAATVQTFKDNALRTVAMEKDAEAGRATQETERVRNAEVERARTDAMAQATSGLAGGLQRLAGGDLSSSLDQPFAADFEGLRNDFNSAVRQLRDAMSAVSDATGAIDNGSRELSTSAGDLSKRTEQQAASLEETAAALDQITANVSNSSKRTDEARTMAIEANESARQSGEVVAQAVHAMQRIEKSSEQISSIIGVIDEIAFQTNLLALNAGVEAARAGEAGKGFAVVAQEVRELAQRSAKAAKEIKELIRNSEHEVQSGVELVSATGSALQTIQQHVVAINGQLDAIATSAREQSVGLNEVNIAVNQMDQVTQQNAAMVEEANAATETLAGEANRLRDLLRRFDIGERAARHVPSSRPATAMPAHATSPARRLVSKVMASIGGAATAPADHWEEF
ncbi:methyl-accepting chemotaxis protein [Neorhizobium alkalisoli]|uniref:Methyl-accepting chemotaxis protein n=1 Tax=Neorhizobium alkalisoli TaxID=528178 RepID=A0A561R3Z6_9HYPH|nr:HAMP domain-containing methyl-accepting chemotaxis protein [Neorhizobium alkalisoli]TWF57329.1 methyl-accepting chemotaxis protein [Neorhizobium alkalisoli]